MTNVYKIPKKGIMKRSLFQAAVSGLEKNGWTVTPVPGAGKSSVRRITKGGESLVVSIRTSQDQWVAFPRMPDDDGWRTLDDVDAVVPVTVDDRTSPRYANVHLIDGDEMRDRFNRAYAARMAAGHSIPVGRGVWVSLYNKEADYPPSLVGAGAGLVHPPLARIPLTPEVIEAARKEPSEREDEGHFASIESAEPLPTEPLPEKKANNGLSIDEAKQGLGIRFGVDPSRIKITIEG